MDNGFVKIPKNRGIVQKFLEEFMIIYGKLQILEAAKPCILWLSSDSLMIWPKQHSPRHPRALQEWVACHRIFFPRLPWYQIPPVFGAQKWLDPIPYQDIPGVFSGAFDIRGMKKKKRKNGVSASKYDSWKQMLLATMLTGLLERKVLQWLLHRVYGTDLLCWHPTATAKHQLAKRGGCKLCSLKLYIHSGCKWCFTMFQSATLY